MTLVHLQNTRDPDAPSPDGITLDTPPYPEMKTIFLGGIFILMLLTIMHQASELFVPLILAFILKLVFQPLQRFLENLGLSRIFAALAILVLVVGGTAGLVSALSGPASVWAEKLSDSLPKLQQRLSFLSDPVESAQKMMADAEKTMNPVIGPKVMPVAVQGTRLADRVFGSMRGFVSSMLTTLLVFFFLLAAGDTFLRRLVEILPRFKDKRQAVDISQQVERDLSVYLLTITLMNASVGVMTALIMYLCGQEDPILWGTIAFFLNYVPIIGPLFGFTIFLLVGSLLHHTIGPAILPAALYLCVHVFESSFVTPLLLARRFTLNPVLVVLSLVFWYWMWGIAGAILAMPMLAITKIICDRIEHMKPLGHFIEGGA